MSPGESPSGICYSGCSGYSGNWWAFYEPKSPCAEQAVWCHNLKPHFCRQVKMQKGTWAGCWSPLFSKLLELQEDCHLYKKVLASVWFIIPLCFSLQLLPVGFWITWFGQELATWVSHWLSLSRSASLCCAVGVMNIPGWCLNPNKQSCHGN